MKAKATPKRVKKPTLPPASQEEEDSAGPKEIPPSPKDAGAQGSGEASPVRGSASPRGGVAMKAKTTSKRVKKPTPPPASQEENETGDSAGPKEMPPSPKDAGARGSGEAFPLRRSPRGGVAMKAKTTSKRVKKPSPASQEEDEAEDSGDASPARDLLDDTTNSGHNKTAGSLKRGVKRPPPQQQEEERRGKGAAGPDGVTVAPSAPQRKKLAVQRSWSYNDEFKILNALAEHAQSGALPESSHLLATLAFDKTDANEDKLNDKIHKLRAQYRRKFSQGCPSDANGCRLFKLSEIVWGQVDKDKRVEPTSRDFSVLSKLYPYLSKEIKGYAETHSSGDLIMARFKTIGDEKARDLDAECKKQHIEAFKFELGQASLVKEILTALV